MTTVIKGAGPERLSLRDPRDETGIKRTRVDIIKLDAVRYQVRLTGDAYQVTFQTNADGLKNLADACLVITDATNTNQPF